MPNRTYSAWMKKGERYETAASAPGELSEYDRREAFRLASYAFREAKDAAKIPVDAATALVRYHLAVASEMTSLGLQQRGALVSDDSEGYRNVAAAYRAAGSAYGEVARAIVSWMAKGKPQITWLSADLAHESMEKAKWLKTFADATDELGDLVGRAVDGLDSPRTLSPRELAATTEAQRVAPSVPEEGVSRPRGATIQPDLHEATTENEISGDGKPPRRPKTRLQVLPVTDRYMNHDADQAEPLSAVTRRVDLNDEALVLKGTGTAAQSSSKRVTVLPLAANPAVVPEPDTLPGQSNQTPAPLETLNAQRGSKEGMHESDLQNAGSGMTMSELKAESQSSKRERSVTSTIRGLVRGVFGCTRADTVLVQPASPAWGSSVTTVKNESGDPPRTAQPRPPSRAR